MSYDIAKNISLKKDGAITITAASNNVYPKTFETFEFLPHVTNPDEKKRLLFNSLIDGEIQIQPSCTSRVHYAFLKALDKLNQDYQLIARDLWFSQYDADPRLTEKETEAIREAIYQEFLVHLDSTVNLREKTYGVALEGGYWLVRMSMYSHRISKQGKGFPLCQAMVYARYTKGLVVSL